MGDRMDRLLKTAELDMQHRLASLGDAERRAAGLARERRSLAAVGPDVLDPAAEAKAGALWRKWREGRLRQIALEEARLRAEREALRAAAARALGRLEVLRSLETRHRKRSG